MFRILCVPLVVVLYLFPFASVGYITIASASISYVDLACLAIFIIASFTDYLDGHIARKYHLITSFGKFIDPIADKLLVNTCFILLAASGRMPLYLVIIMIWRDTIVDAIRMIASQHQRVMAAAFMGKVKTVLQMIAIIVLFLNNVPFVFIGVPMDQLLAWAATIVSVISGIQYFLQAKDILLESM